MIGIVTALAAFSAEMFTNGVLLGVTVYTASRTGRTTRNARKRK